MQDNLLAIETGQIRYPDQLPQNHQLRLDRLETALKSRVDTERGQDAEAVVDALHWSAKLNNERLAAERPRPNLAASKSLSAAIVFDWNFQIDSARGLLQALQQEKWDSVPWHLARLEEDLVKFARPVKDYVSSGTVGDLGLFMDQHDGITNRSIAGFIAAKLEQASELRSCGLNDTHAQFILGSSMKALNTLVELQAINLSVPELAVPRDRIETAIGAYQDVLRSIFENRQEHNPIMKKLLADAPEMWQREETISLSTLFGIYKKIRFNSAKYPELVDLNHDKTLGLEHHDFARFANLVKDTLGAELSGDPLEVGLELYRQDRVTEHLEFIDEERDAAEARV